MTDSQKKPSLTCADIEVLISGIIDGELDRDVRHEAELHLLACPACREKVNQAEALDQLVAAAGERNGPDVLPDRVRLGVMAAIQREKRRNLRFPALAWSGWAVAALLALMVFVVNPFSPPASPGQMPGSEIAQGNNTSARIILAADEQQALGSVHLLARVLGGEITDQEYNDLLETLRRSAGSGENSLINRLLGKKGRTALHNLASRKDLNETQRRVLQLAEQLVDDLDRGQAPPRQDWQQLDVAMSALRIG
ncbi:MAG TPA: hypothetical protein ENJ06_04515 [Phycisphaeraceae bacterium]|nr:hypothetical protein [Phycisphaeraceae bacterium]